MRRMDQDQMIIPLPADLRGIQELIDLNNAMLQQEITGSWQLPANRDFNFSSHMPAAAPSLSECTESFMAKKRANGEGNIRKRTLSCCLVHCLLSAYGSRYGSAGFTQNIVQLLDRESKRKVPKP